MVVGSQAGLEDQSEEKEGYVSTLNSSLWRYSGQCDCESVLMFSRRLGLAGNSEDDTERRIIITNYMEMAQQVCQVHGALLMGRCSTLRTLGLVCCGRTAGTDTRSM